MKRKFLPFALFLALASPLFSQDEAEANPLDKIEQAFSNLPEETRKEYQEHRLKAAQFFRQKRTFESLDEIYKAQRIFDSEPGLWNLKGSCHVEFRNFKDAKVAYGKALALDGSNTGILFNLAEMDFVTSDWGGATKKFGLLMGKLEADSDGEMEGTTLDLHRLALFKKMLSEIKLNNLDESKKLAEKHQEEWDDTPFTYYSKAAFAYQQGNEDEANQWIMSAVRVFGGIEKVANWQDTLIEFGYIKSFYGNDDEAQLIEQ